MNKSDNAQLEKGLNSFNNRFGVLSLVAGARLPLRRFRPPAFWSNRVLDSAKVDYQRCSAAPQAMVLRSCEGLNEN